MARIDKISFSFRAPAGTALSGLKGVYLNSGGSAVLAGTAAGQAAVGVVCVGGTIAAGDIVSIIRSGEIVELGGTVSGTYYAGASGAISTTSTNATQVGYSVEADRLVVAM